MKKDNKETPLKDIEKTLNDLRILAEKQGGSFVQQVKELEKELAREIERCAEGVTTWQVVGLSRDPKRPNFSDYASQVFTDFIQLHGDRRFSDDQAICGGFARLDKKPVLILGHNKGKTLEENIARNFGSAKPDGYRKAMRLMKLADQFNVPIISLIDTAGAYPGVEAEERGQSEAIARNLVEMMHLEVPVICIITGEGGSGGALGIGVGNRVMMLSNAIYSVISPEGCAGILWRDGAFAPQAAEALKLTAPSLLELGVVDRIIQEPEGGAHEDPQGAMKELKRVLLEELKVLEKMGPSALKKQRYEKFTKMGKFIE